MITITLSRKRGEITVPTTKPPTLPTELSNNLSKISVAELKRICDLWGVSKKGKSADIRNAIEFSFSTEPTSIKKDRGQFNTKNASYIFQNMVPLKTHTVVIDPCAGDGDLIEFVQNLGDFKAIMYDCDPTKIKCETRNTLLNPVDYSDTLLVMNPPYLSNVQNKLPENATIYEQYGKDDLFKCYVQTMLNYPPVEFMIILPLNFLCSIRVADRNLRRQFFQKFDILRINIFNEQVFPDTTYNVCSIHGKNLISNSNKSSIIPTAIFPQKNEINLVLSEENGYLIGGEIYELPICKKIIVGRATTEKANNVSNIYLKAIDDSIKINLSLAEHPSNKEFGKISDRSYAWITLNPMLNEREQSIIVRKFNLMISEWREKYHGLFLTNFRDNGRKRISFELVFRIIGHIISIGFDEYDFPEIFTKTTRNEIIGSNTKANICEKWQIDQLRSIGVINDAVAGTNIRINHITFEIANVASGLFNTLEFADWSEDFDIISEKGDETHYFNLKFICESGGSQNRSIKPLANMIYYIAKHIEMTKCENKKFIFITDGEYLMNFVLPNNQNSVSQFHWQIDRVDPAYRKYFFIGSTKQYIKYIKSLNS